MSKMKRQGAKPTVSVVDLARSWRLALTAENKSKRTIEVYGESARMLVRYLTEHELPLEVAALTRQHVERFIAQLLATRSPSTASARYRALKLFFAFAVEEGELAVSPMTNMKPPIVPETPVPLLTPTEIDRLLKVCGGAGFADRRDHAIISLLVDTGIRRGELAGLKVDEIDLDTRVAVVLGKGRRPRAVPFGNATARSLDRYLRARAGHELASGPWLWLGVTGQPLAAQGVRQMLERRGAQAGVDNLHAHRFRHTFAHEHLADGGNEGDLMMLTGWKSRQMLSRYASSTAAQRARESYRSPLDRRKDPK